MEDVGLTSEEISGIWRILAAVLKLGNVQFVPTTNMDGTEGCTVANDYGEKSKLTSLRPCTPIPFRFPELYDVCEMLHGDFDGLKAGLTSRTIEVRHDVLVTDLNAREAISSRDALCRAIYGRLFTWLVGRINDALRVTSSIVGIRLLCHVYCCRCCYTVLLY